MKKWILRGCWLLLVVLGLAAIGFVVWAEDAAAPLPAAIAALEGDGEVAVETGEWLVFSPTAGQPKVGLILYPGGRVDARAYAPTARAISEEGILVVIVPMPLNLAVFGADRA